VGGFVVRSGEPFSLFGNKIGDTKLKEVEAALKHKPTPEVLKEQAQVKERLLWQTFMLRPTSLCHHQLCHPQSQLAVHTVLCVDARLYFEEGNTLVYIPTEVWYVILSFLRTKELGVCIVYYFLSFQMYFIIPDATTRAY
jgi:hypothetical protein